MTKKVLVRLLSASLESGVAWKARALRPYSHSFDGQFTFEFPGFTRGGDRLGLRFGRVARDPGPGPRLAAARA